MNLIDHFHLHQSIPVMSICQVNPRNKRSKDFSSKEDDPTKKWNIRFGFGDKSRTINHIGIWMFFKHFEEIFHICYVVLPIGIKCHNIFPLLLFRIFSNICKTSFQSCSCPTIYWMSDKVYFFSKFFF